MEIKICNKCKQSKPMTIEYFGKSISTKDGFQYRCKECLRAYHIEHRETHIIKMRDNYRKKHPKEEIQEGYKKCASCGEIKSATNDYFGNATKNKDGLKHTCKTCRKQKEYSNQIEHIARVRKKYYEENKLEISKECKKYRAKNKERYRLYDAQYYKENKIVIKENVKTNMYARLKIDVNYKLLVRYRTRLYKAVKGYDKSKTTRELIGCSVEELKKHLESQFTEGMTFENYGEWHVDHIIPCSSFDFSKEEEQMKCFNYKNLQPLWAIDNLRKSDKII